MRPIILPRPRRHLAVVPGAYRRPKEPPMPARPSSRAHDSARRNARHAMLLAGVSAAALFMAYSEGAARPLGGQQPASSAAAIASAQSGAQEAARAARAAQNSLKRATMAIQAQQ